MGLLRSRFFPFALIAVGSFFYLAATPSELSPQRVRHVIDGDTIVLQGGEHVRLIGVNSPEYQPWKHKVEPYGKEAKDFLTRLVAGKNVYLESDSEKKDRYGRILAYVYLPDGSMVNRLLVAEGMARARYYKPNSLHREELEKEESAASLSQKGLWKNASR